MSVTTCNCKLNSGPDLEEHNRQSPIASDFGLQTQIAAFFAVLTYRTVELRITNLAFRIAIQIARAFRATNPAFSSR